MTSITLKSIEPRLAQRLRQQADRNGRTIEEEITIILSNAVEAEQVKEEEVDLFTAIRRRVAPVGGIDLPETPREAIRTPPLF